MVVAAAAASVGGEHTTSDDEKRMGLWDDPEKSARGLRNHCIHCLHVVLLKLFTDWSIVLHFEVTVDIFTVWRL